MSFARCMLRLTAGLALAATCGLLTPIVHGRSAPAVVPVTRPALIAIAPAADAQLPVRIDSVSIRADLVGTLARTRVEIVVSNPNERVLEGQLQFPLLAGQVVTGFALDIDGHLRSAVPVPKAKGRQVFEDITRTQVDPALLQVTQGNNYSLRIYPLPARGQRRVQLELSETLTRDRADRATWRMPLQFGQPIGRLDLAVRVTGLCDAQQISAALGAHTLTATADRDGSLIRWTQVAFDTDAVLTVRHPGATGPVVATESDRGRIYFYADLPAGVDAAAQPRLAPRRLALLWDASGSGAQRDHAAELALLDAYLRHLGQVDVTLTVVRDAAEPPAHFRVRRGDWRALRERLQSIVYDGATNSSAMLVPADSDAALLFSDGLGNYGESGLPPSRVPLFTINASPRADTAALRVRAESSGGEAVDLVATSTREALRQLTTQRPRVVALGGSQVTELVATSVYAHQGRYQVAGLLTAPSGELSIHLLTPDGRRITRRVAIAHRDSASAPAIAARQWSQLRWTEMSADGERQRASMERLALSYRLLTPQTSLIVLDAAADYVRHAIAPPADEPALVQAVGHLAQQQAQRVAQARASQLARVSREFAERIAWWERSFPQDTPPAAPRAKAAAAPGSVGMVMESASADHARRELRSPAPAAPAQLAPARLAGASDRAPRSPTIALKRWQPDSPYARRMRAAADADDLYAIYLDERPGYLDSTAFFLDAADILAERQQPALALRVLSNLAEMNLEDRHILRILAYRLQQHGQALLALPLLARVRHLAPDEPQSWRDLGLALAGNGQHQAAVDALWHVVSQPWHGRFPGIELIALTELNAVAAHAQGSGVALDTGAIPPALLRNLPVALRVVLTWDADNTDIDLWVTDPDGQRAYYGHRLTYQGGAMSRDFTGGYGPEEFSLRRPKPGKYKVQAQFYGHRQQIVAPATTLMLQFITDFGTPQERNQRVVLRLSGAGQLVDVGEFEVAAAPDQTAVAPQ